MSKTILSSNGYSINKADFPSNVLAATKRDLTIEPFVEKPEYGAPPPPIQLYHETQQRMYMPRFYGVKAFGPPQTDKITSGMENAVVRCPNIKMKPEFALFDYQIPICKKMLTHISTQNGGVLSLSCGLGKCLGKDTAILMHSGEIKKVQDIKVGDLLMGDDSTPRTVLSLARGRETMYKVVPTKGEPYTVNESHILSLKVSGHKSIIKYAVKGEQLGWKINWWDHSVNRMSSRTFCDTDLNIAHWEAEEFSDTITDSDVVDMSITDYLALPKSFHGRAGRLYGYRVGVDFPDKPVDIDPYYLGLWLGDGSSRDTMITNIDKEIVDFIYKYKDQLNKIFAVNLHVTISSDEIGYRIAKSNGGSVSFNPLYNMLTKHNLLQNKHIPMLYKTNSRNIRLQVLAGLIDSDGSCGNNMYEITQKNKVLIDDIAYLCRSLGFAAYVKKCRKQCTNHSINTDGWGDYYRCHISGSGLEQVPVLLKRKKCNPRKQIKDALVTRIKLEKSPVDDYYGFTLDGNHRFLLGDYTVTHNTLGGGLWLATQLQVKTVVVCHTTDLMNQWKNEILEWLPTAKVGVIQCDKCEIEGNDIIIASLKTLAQKQFPDDHFKTVGLAVWDEIHLMCTQLFSDAFPKLTTLYSLGLSATPFRKDKCEKIFEYYIGPIFHMEKRAKDSTVQVRSIVFKHPVVIEKNYKNDLMYTTTLIKIVYGVERVNYIVKEILELVQTGRKLLVLSEYVDHLKGLRAKLEANEIFLSKKNPDPSDTRKYRAGLYVGEMKNDQRMVSREADVILGTYKMASVGMNIPTLDTVLLASPRKDQNQLEQSIGRIFRKQTKHNKLIVDIIDDHNIFISQGRERKKFYQLYDYTIVQENRDSAGVLISKRKVTKKEAKTVEVEANEPDITKFLIVDE